MAAVGAVNKTIETMGTTGDLDEFNRALKAARKVDPSIRYVDPLEAKKAANAGGVGARDVRVSVSLPAGSRRRGSLGLTTVRGRE